MTKWSQLQARPMQASPALTVYSGQLSQASDQPTSWPKQLTMKKSWNKIQQNKSTNSSFSSFFFFFAFFFFFFLGHARICACGFSSHMRIMGKFDDYKSFPACFFWVSFLPSLVKQKYTHQKVRKLVFYNDQMDRCFPFCLCFVVTMVHVSLHLFQLLSAVQWFVHSKYMGSSLIT